MCTEELKCFRETTHTTMKTLRGSSGDIILHLFSLSQTSVSQHKQLKCEPLMKEQAQSSIENFLKSSLTTLDNALQGQALCFCPGANTTGPKIDPWCTPGHQEKSITYNYSWGSSGPVQWGDVSAK